MDIQNILQKKSFGDICDQIVHKYAAEQINLTGTPLKWVIWLNLL